MSQNYKRMKESSSSQSPFLGDKLDGRKTITSADSSTTSNTNPFTYDMITGLITSISTLQLEVNNLKELQENKSTFIKSSIALSNTARIIIIVLILIPALQVIVCAAIVYSLGIQGQFPGLLSWGLGGLGVLSLLEVIIGGVKLYLSDNKIKVIEQKLEKLEEK